MPSSDARINANRQNALKSTGPKTAEGKAQSRANSCKHGLTGAGVVLPVEEASAVEERCSAFVDELQPTSSLGLTLVRRAATLAVRMEKCAERDLEATAERVARAIAEFEVPDGVDEAEATRLRIEAGRIAAFDTSRAAVLARRYEAAAERGFYKALKEFQTLQKQARASDSESFPEMLGSFGKPPRLDDEFEAEVPEPAVSVPQNRFESQINPPLAHAGGRFDVPFTIGRSR